MASFAAACRLSSRLAVRQMRQETTARGYRTSAACLAAQNFTMPAMSPTMTEGNISSWKVKEGDSFVVGDVLLEIETDKAQMDVEAQDDGIMAKIMHPDGSKGIKVGTRIGVLAEPDDDLSTLEIPADDSSTATPKAPKEEAPKPEAAKSSPSQAEAPPASKPRSSESTEATSKPKKSAKAKAQTYPLLPSVEVIMHQNGLSKADIEKMTPTGPNNRLLKGDVLAYLGSIKADYPAALSAKLNKLTHLDLSNVKVAPQKEVKKSKKEEARRPEAPKAIDVAMPISMAAVIEVQKRIQATLGVSMPIATFLARAVDFANDDLPRSKTASPTADELFNSVLGLDRLAPCGVRGNLMPQITALPATSLSHVPRRSAPKSDIIDILAGKKSTPRRSAQFSAAATAGSPAVNIFSVSVPKGDEKRAQIFLERIKTVLEAEPGSLVL